MDSTQYFDVLELERSGRTEEGFLQLARLAEEGDPLALLDLSSRYYSTEGFAPPVKKIKRDEKKSEQFALIAEKRLLKIANSGDGEAMRMLANTYLGHWHPVLKKPHEIAESWLLKAYEANCYLAANDLATFYQYRDIEKAKHYYQEAECHGCRVIFNSSLE
jgi:hypothetical protein